MSLQEFPTAMEAHWQALVRQGEREKDAQFAPFALRDWYRNLSADERLWADQVLSEWVQSTDVGQQFDPLSVVREFRIRSAVPALTQLIAQLESTAGPEARFPKAKVLRILDHLKDQQELKGSNDANEE